MKKILISILLFCFLHNGNAQNVGIGTITPTQKLHVAGTIRTTALEGDQTNDLNISNSQSINSTALLFAWFTGANERMRISNSGNVGIGTASPGQLLEVVGPENTSIDLKTGALTLRSSVNTVAGAQFGTVSAHTLNLFTNNANRLTILSGGNVGIGTPTPAQKLHVAGTIRTTALEGDQTNDLNISNSQSINSTALLFAWFTGANERMRISNSGNVGIGTAVPTSKLQVVGISVYANNAAAIAAGLTVGAFYRTGGDPSVVCVVF